jgi:hypothetical protein
LRPGIICVLRSGGPYDAEDVLRLKAGVEQHMPGARFRCIADTPVRGVHVIPMAMDWPGWWSKMEAFRPDIPGDWLYLDLDSIIVGSLADMLHLDRLAIMRDVYRPNGLQSSVMWLPEAERWAVWEAFTAQSERHMRRHHAGGDQSYLEEHWLGRASLWQDALPGQVVSYKVHCRDGVPKGARLVVFHGRPKPRDMGWKL